MRGYGLDYDPARDTQGNALHIVGRDLTNPCGYAWHQCHEGGFWTSAPETTAKIDELISELGVGEESRNLVFSAPR